MGPHDSQDPLLAYSPDLLKALHILTRDGKLNQDSRRKLKQIEHLGQLCHEQLMSKVFSPTEDFRLCDVGAGKNYLSFLLWDRYYRGRPGAEKLHLYAIESRDELARKSRALAEKIGIPNFHVIHGRAEAAGEQLPAKLDLVLALHACDTATDDAIKLALRTEAQAVALVPCCQAEAARQLGELSAKSSLYPLWRFPLHRRELGSHLTNVIRCLYLESQGYKVRCTEFTGFEHTQKNELILAEKVQKHNSLAERALAKLLENFPIRPYLLDSSSP